jgi:protein N-terminal methyltransferase
MVSSNKTKKKRTAGGAKPQLPDGTHTAGIHTKERPICPDTIKGVDDAGNYYNSHDELAKTQLLNREEYYDANDKFWSEGGYGGKTDDEVMVGDGGGAEDGVEGLAFLDRLLARQSTMPAKPSVAVDLGAGVGRVTKMILLKRYDEVRLVEPNEGFSKHSKVYLGRKRAARCVFNCLHLQDISTDDIIEWGEADLMWVQWCLQYLTDDDFIKCLRTLAGGLRPGVGVLVVKENRPYGNAREDRFQMDTPQGSSGQGRYDITRPDAHHRLLFQRAGLRVDFVEKGVETNTYALMSI